MRWWISVPDPRCGFMTVIVNGDDEGRITETYTAFPEARGKRFVDLATELREKHGADFIWQPVPEKKDKA